MVKGCGPFWVGAWACSPAAPRLGLLPLNETAREEGQEMDPRNRGPFCLPLFSLPDSNRRKLAARQNKSPFQSKNRFFQGIFMENKIAGDDEKCLRLRFSFLLSPPHPLLEKGWYRWGGENLD